MHDIAPPLNGHPPPRRDRGLPRRDQRSEQNRSLLTHLIRLAALGGVFAASAGSIPPFEASGTLGDVLLLGATSMCLWGVLRTPVRVWTDRLFSMPGFWLAAFLAVYATSALGSPSGTAFKHTAQIVVVSIVFLFFSTLDREFVTSRSMRWLTWLYGFYLIAAVFLVHKRIVSGDFVIKNAVGGAVLGGLGLLLFVFVALRPKFSRLSVALPIYLVVGVILGMLVDHRMLMLLFALALPMCLLVYAVWNNTLLRRGIFWATVGLITINVMLNVKHEDFALSRFLHELSVEIFGRRFFSGREDIWIAVLAEIDQSPWFGHGAGVVPSRLINSELSSHNLYLQILLQVGIVGLIPLALFFRSVLARVFRQPRTAASVVAVTNILGVMIYNCYEVVLTQNTLAVGVVEWSLIGLAFVSVADPVTDDGAYLQPDMMGHDV